MEAPLKCSSQFLCLRNRLLHLLRTPSPPSSPSSRLFSDCNSVLRDERQVGQTVSCSSHDRRHPLRAGERERERERGRESERERERARERERVSEREGAWLTADR